MVEKALKPRKGLGWKWISLIVVMVLVVGFLSGAIFTYREGPGAALPNIGEAISDLINKVTGGGSSSQVGGGPAPTSYTDWQTGVVPTELQGVVTLECQYRWYQREDLQDAKYRQVHCNMHIRYTNLSEDKTIKTIAVKLFFMRGDEKIKEDSQQFSQTGGVKPGETSTPGVGYGFDITYWGDWRWTDLSAQVQLESLVYL